MPSTENKPKATRRREREASAIARTLGYDLPVFPCRAGTKRPLIADWPNRASVEAKTIRSWWRKSPKAKVAIACGGTARLLVVDIDPDKGGDDSLRALERDHGELPPTLAVRTPRGGQHLYLTVPGGHRMLGNSVGLLGVGLDTRGQSGYVLCPPSKVDGKPYRWRNRRKGAWIHPAPTWLVELLDQGTVNGRVASPEDWLDLITSGVDDGQRNDAVISLAGLLFRYLPETDARAAAELVACWNQVKCRPPLEPAELTSILDWIAAREGKRRGLLP